MPADEKVLSNVRGYAVSRMYFEVRFPFCNGRLLHIVIAVSTLRVTYFINYFGVNLIICKQHMAKFTQCGYTHFMYSPALRHRVIIELLDVIGVCFYILKIRHSSV